MSTSVHEPSPRPNTRQSVYRPTNNRTRAGEGANKKFVLNLETMDTAGLVSNVDTGMSVYINIIASLMTARTVLDQLSLMLGLT